MLIFNSKLVSSTSKQYFGQFFFMTLDLGWFRCFKGRCGICWVAFKIIPEFRILKESQPQNAELSRE